MRSQLIYIKGWILLYENIITSHETLVSAFCLKKIKDDQVFGIIFVVFSIMSWL